MVRRCLTFLGGGCMLDERPAVCSLTAGSPFYTVRRGGVLCCFRTPHPTHNNKRATTLLAVRVFVRYCSPALDRASLFIDRIRACVLPGRYAFGIFSSLYSFFPNFPGTIKPLPLSRYQRFLHSTFLFLLFTD